MKKTTILIYMLSLLGACAPIAKDDYLIEVDTNVPGDDGGDTETPVYYKSVLIEDFTGQACVNCPDAADVIDGLRDAYGDKIVPVAIHCNPMGFAGNAKNLGLMTELGKAYGEYWGVATQPVGLVNRVGGLSDRSQWLTAVAAELSQETPLALALDNTYDEETQTACIKVELKANAAVTGKLQVWLVEDGITAMQKTPQSGSGYDRTYVHNHVFRAAVNGAWGDAVSVLPGQAQVVEYTFALTAANHQAYQPDYVPGNCAAVAFVYGSDGVVQAAIGRIK